MSNSSTSTIPIRLRRPHRNQRQIIAEADRFNVVNCGRRWGKTVMGIDRAVRGPKGLGRGYPVGWFAPQYKLLKQAWRDLVDILKPITLRASDQDKRIELINGGVLEGWAFDRNPDAGRSRRYGTAIVDEAAHCDNLEMAWSKAIRPTLSDFKGDAWFISSPNADNFFHKLYERGEARSPGWRSWTQTTYDNPFIDPAEIDSAKLDLSDWIFDQEYMAVFHAESAGALAPPAWIDRMPSVNAECDRLRRQGKGGRRFLSADLGEGTGRDSTVIKVRDRLGILLCLPSNQVGIPEAADLVAEHSRAFDVRQEDIVYDAGGRGKDLPRYLEHHRITQAYAYHGSASGGNNFANKRSKVAWRLRQRLDPERPEPVRPAEAPPDRKPSPFDRQPKPRPAEIQPPFGYGGDPRHWERLAEEMKGLRATKVRRKIKLELKEDMAKRLGRSPDLVDSLLMSFSLEPD